MRAAGATGVLVELPRAAKTGWPKHTAPCFANIHRGGIAVTAKDGPAQTSRTDDAFAGLIGIEHNSLTIGTEPVRPAFFAAGLPAGRSR